ncbi:hypothetical protein CC78DRAFT_535308 [Lojkania enalia]|uniref:DUF7779 domain-containing protein n=1 Tax=Lojkania enalia TaxID=147567 RepID=A0A9P4K871_9PLEO|nr:hypothetical protein CC78DRAFT_535308 [Didymosphaeria enalia]
MYRHFDTGRYPVILWLYASNQMKLESQFIVLTRQLGIKTNESDARDAVLHWINHLDRPFLIIFDNADDPSFLPSFWPSSIRGSVLITSRNLNARDVNLAKDGIHLKAFSDDAGSEFLCSMLDEGQTKSDTDKEAIQSLARYFGGLPLALRQAGTFMTRKSISPSQFKHLYQQRFEEIEMLEVADYEKTVADTWAISSSTLTEDARILLDTLSLLDPDSIPTELFDVTELAHPHAEFLSDPLRVLDAREDLTSQSLVDHDSHSNCFSIHRLFQEITFRKLKKDVKRLRHTLHFAATLIHKFSPEIDLMMIRSPHLWKPVEKTLSHIHSLHERCKNAVTEPEAALLLRIMTKVLNYAFESAQYTLGDQAFDNAQELLQKISDPDHEVLALLYFIHGRLCCETSQPQQAVSDLTYSCKHIEIAAKAKPELLNTTLYIRILSNLGIVYTAVNQFKKAEKFHKQAIQCCRDLKMEKECSMGNILQNLAGTYLWSGDLPKAKETLDEAQRAPNTAVEAAEYTLGNWMLMSERYDEAAILHKGALEKYAKQLGSKHPVVADSWHKMGTLFALPEYSGHDDHEAERCFRQNLSIWTTLDASRNPMSALFLARGQWGLGSFLAKLGPSHQDEAQKMKQEALDFLHRRFEGNLPGDKDPGEVLEDLVFYWSR